MKIEPANIADWPKFKVGDRVICDGTDGARSGKPARVVKVETDTYGQSLVNVVWDGETTWSQPFLSWRFRLAAEAELALGCSPSDPSKFAIHGQTLATFDGGYNREGVIEVVRYQTCDVCKQEKPKLLYVDGSEGEYAPGLICKDCAIRALES